MNINSSGVVYRFTAVVVLLFILGLAQANDVTIVAAEFSRSENNQWSVSVTLQHADSGWEHYADNWRVTDGSGNILGDRVLHHPHIDEQPFTRSLSGVSVPEGITVLSIEAHDKLHGWTSKRLQVDLSQVDGDHFRIEAE